MAAVFIIAVVLLEGGQGRRAHLNMRALQVQNLGTSGELHTRHASTGFLTKILTQQTRDTEIQCNGKQFRSGYAVPQCPALDAPARSLTRVQGACNRKRVTLYWLKMQCIPFEIADIF